MAILKETEMGKFPVNPGILEKFEEILMEHLNMDVSDINFVLVDTETMAELNEKYRNKEGSTDVLSFDLGLNNDEKEFPGDEGPLGEVYICPEKAASNAAEHGESLTNELGRLMIHGLLHLAGYDHETEEDAEIMQNAEKDLFAYLRGVDS